MRNIWIINQYSTVPKYGGTAGVRHYYIGKQLINKGYQVTIIASSFTHLSERQPQLTDGYLLEHIDGVRYLWLKTTSYDTARGIKRLYSMFEFTAKLFFLRRYLDDTPDVIIVSSLSIYPVLPGIYLKHSLRRSGVKFVFEVRDIWPLTLTEIGGYSKYHPFVKFTSLVEKLGYSNADYVISVLADLDKHIGHRVNRTPPFKWIPNGVNKNFNFHLEPPKDLVGKLSKDNLIIGYIGALGVANAMKVFIESAKLLSHRKNITFLIVGDGYQKSELLELSKGYDNIIFYPRVSKNNVGSILNIMDVLFLSFNNNPNLYQYGISPNKLYEYMLASKPILCSMPSLITDFISDTGSGILVPPNNPQALADAISSLDNLPSTELKALGQRAHQYVLEHNTFTVLGDNYISVFNELFDV